MASVSKIVHYQMDSQIAAAIAAAPTAAVKLQVDQLEAPVNKLCYLLTNPDLGGAAGPQVFWPS